MKLHYPGHSVLLDFKGKPLLEFSENESAIKTTSIPKTELDKFREKYAFWRDADRFSL